MRCSRTCRARDHRSRRCTRSRCSSGQNSTTGLWGQYLHYWNNLLHGNLGVSTSEGMAPVTTVIRGALPWTIGLVGMATVLSFVLGTLIGILVAWRRGTWLDNLLPVTTFFQAAPYFFLAFLAIDLFSIKLGWFPSGRASGSSRLPGRFNWTYISDVLYHAALPALTIVLCLGGRLDRRHAERDGHDDGRGLRADRAGQGPAEERVVWYAARNAILPSISGFSLAIGFVVSGALLTEIVFSYPGLGFILLRRCRSATTRCCRGSSCHHLGRAAANLAADFVYVFLDPRTRQEA